MAVGNQPTTSVIDQQLTNLALTMRNLMQQFQNLSKQVNGQGTGLQYMEQIGYSSAANPQNPGNLSDAAWALQCIGYMNTLAGVYYGTASQGSEFDFDNALALLWCGQ